MGRWQERDHTADLCIHVWGESLADLFTTSARGMFALLGGESEAAPSTETHVVRLDAVDTEALLVDWLNELLYLAERDQLTAYTQVSFDVLTPTSLQARVVGSPVETFRTYIKAATYHNLAVRLTPTGYETEIVFDI